MAEAAALAPLYITMHEGDNVAIVANDGGLPAGTRFPSGLTLVDKVPQGHKVALVDLAAGDAVRRYNVVIGRAARAIAAGSWVHERLLEMPAGPVARRPADRDRSPAAAAAARGLHLRGLPQCRRLGRKPQHPGDHDHGAMRRRRGRACGQADQGRAAAALSERRRRRRPGAHLRLRRRDRRARRDRADPHPAQHQPEPELRQRGDGGEPGLREAAARTAPAAGQLHDRRRAQRRRHRRYRRVPASTSSASRTRATSASCR